jgi:hypothetical protein
MQSQKNAFLAHALLRLWQELLLGTHLLLDLWGQLTKDVLILCNLFQLSGGHLVHRVHHFYGHLGQGGDRNREIRDDSTWYVGDNMPFSPCAVD